MENTKLVEELKTALMQDIEAQVDNDYTKATEIRKYAEEMASTDRANGVKNIWFKNGGIFDTSVQRAKYGYKGVIQEICERGEVRGRDYLRKIITDKVNHACVMVSKKIEGLKDITGTFTKVSLFTEMGCLFTAKTETGENRTIDLRVILACGDVNIAHYRTICTVRK